MKENLQQTEDRLVLSFLNGNRNDTYAELMRMKKALLAVVIARIVDRLPGSDRDSFLRLLEERL